VVWNSLSGGHWAISNIGGGVVGNRAGSTVLMGPARLELAGRDSRDGEGRERECGLHIEAS
jgi:hypothetical protein